MVKISQNTVIPIGVAVVVIGGGAAWMTKINYAVDAHAAKIEEARHSETSRYREFLEIARLIEHRLSVIEGELKRIRK